MNQDPGESRAVNERAEARGVSRGAVVERIFREYNESLIRFLQTRLPSAQDAREVAQEAYVRLLQLDQPEAIGFLRAYLFKTAAHIATDRLRHRQIVRQNEASSAFDTFQMASPMEKIAAQQDLDIVNAALDELSPKCREVFLLRRLGNLQTEEVARQTGIGGRMVRLYVAQALTHCYRSLQRAHAVRGDAVTDDAETMGDSIEELDL
jgi:RNA polymerase sigma-70 factor (ECF subfamily)